MVSPPASRTQDVTWTGIDTNILPPRKSQVLTARTNLEQSARHSESVTEQADVPAY